MTLPAKDILKDTLTQNILPFWMAMRDCEHGGFYGEADFYGAVQKNADKGCVLNSRLLWTFATSERVLSDKAYRPYSCAAFDSLRRFFYDEVNGGLYWLCDAKGAVIDTKKQVYAQAFGVYALAEYYRAVQDTVALDLAYKLYECIETYAADKKCGGYGEAYSKNWGTLANTALSGRDMMCDKSMNTNLHIMEAYTALLLARPDDETLRRRLIELVEITMSKIVVNGRFRLYFDSNWQPLNNEVSFGHDIEGSWLILEAAQAAGDSALITRTREMSVIMANTVLENGLCPNGGLLDNHESKTKAWWPQAEAVVGFYNAYRLTQDERFLTAAANIFNYIKKHFYAPGGEWHNELTLDNSPVPALPRAGLWKCPYHNGRMYLELMKN